MVNNFIHMKNKENQGVNINIKLSHCETVNLNVGSLSWRMCDVKQSWGAIKLS